MHLRLYVDARVRALKSVGKDRASGRERDRGRIERTKQALTRSFTMSLIFGARLTPPGIDCRE